ncbi:uncharacterized protein EV422DRAFT_571090 [Fimicolochytrium jonesii]|uniref:uncharacterized protein n=1 Tax=Fimicolochytrium jonesii TaxID=1396493 RepID=UPI0022FDDBA1|nr:uncharacterized protein EV422DRAFT_571090 [Fimicolochytrium jonesii]KAI8817010.1 hypothetical protein EV422DRAFT_571090 [Fimicolochytrium jonesii]
MRIIPVLWLVLSGNAASAAPRSNANNRSASSLSLNPKPAFPPLPADYETFSAVRKEELLWEKLSASANSSQAWNSDIDMGALLVTLPPRPPFGHRNIEMIPGRKKFIRNRGAHSRVCFESYPSIHNYTGFWKVDGRGILRLTTVSEPPKSLKADDVLIAPGGSLKLLRDGSPSANLFFIYTLDGQKGSWNYFMNPLSNHLGPPKDLSTKVAKKLNQRVRHYSEMTGTSGMATFTANGQVVSNPKGPFQVWLVPSAEIKANPPQMTPETASANFASHLKSSSRERCSITFGRFLSLSSHTTLPPSTTLRVFQRVSTLATL